MDPLLIPHDLYRRIMDTIGAVPPEAGGVFSLEGNTMRRFCYDAEAGHGKRFYRPTADTITGTVNRWLRDPAQRFGGFIHSHPPGNPLLSPMDLVCAEMTMRCNDLPWLYMAVLSGGIFSLYRVTEGAPPAKWDFRILPPSD